MNSQKRILSIFLRLLAGETLTKKELMETYQKESSTIQRDIATIEEVLIEHGEERFFKKQTAESYEEYVAQHTIKREEKGHYALNVVDFFQSSATLTKEEVIVLLKILLASRSLATTEMDDLYEKITSLTDDTAFVKSFMGNEKLYYQGVPQENLLEKLTTICQMILKNSLIAFDYTKNGQTQTLERVPNAIYFSDMYFYMITSSHTGEDNVDLSTLNKFRISNIQHLRTITPHTKVAYSDRFEGGLLRKQTSWPFLGHPITLVIDFYYDPVYVLDRFPDSKILYEKNGVSRIEMHVNDGFGMKMWLLSQGHQVNIISPKHMRDYVVNVMVKTLSYYDMSIDLPADIQRLYFLDE